MKYTFGNIPTTKGEMTKILKRYGVRKGDTSDGRTVKLEHMKYEDLCVLFDKFAEALAEKAWENNGMPEPYGTGDGLRFTEWVEAHPVEKVEA